MVVDDADDDEAEMDVSVYAATSHSRRASPFLNQKFTQGRALDFRVQGSYAWGDRSQPSRGAGACNFKILTRRDDPRRSGSRSQRLAYPRFGALALRLAQQSSEQI